MRFQRLAVLVLALTAGCASLPVKKITDQEREAPQVNQLIYYLPRTVIVTTVTLTLNKCGDTLTYSDDKSEHYYNLDVDESISSTATTEADTDYQYAISLDDARTWLKEINFTLATNPNGTIQSFNGQINDQSGPLAVAAATTVAKIVGAAILPGVPHTSELAFERRAIDQGLVQHPKKKPHKQKSVSVLCTPEVVNAIKEIKSAQVKLASITKKKVDGDYSQDQKDSDLAAVQDALSAAKRKVTLQHTAVIHWTPTRTGKDSIVGSYNLIHLLKGWLSSDGLALLDCCHADKEWKEAFSKISVPVNVELDINHSTMGWSVPPSDSKFNENDPGGIVLRQPALGTLRVCRGECTHAKDGSLLETSNDLVPAQQIAVAQFGQLRVYPEKSSVFENATLVLTVNADGSLIGVADHIVNSAAIGATGLGTAADAVSAGIAARNTAMSSVNSANAAKAVNADTLNKAHADCLAQKAAIEAANETALACQ